jgi:hypothetical protein
VTLWSLLSARFFSNVVATGFDGSTVQAMEDDLRKLYVQAERARRRARENHLRRARSASAKEVLFCGGSGLLSERAKQAQRKAAPSAVETDSLSECDGGARLRRKRAAERASEASAKKGGLLCGGNKLAQRAQRKAAPFCGGKRPPSQRKETRLLLRRKQARSASVTAVLFCGGSGQLRWGLSGGDPPNPPAAGRTCARSHTPHTRSRRRTAPSPPPPPLTPILHCRYLVSCILHNQRDLVTAFFNDASGAAGPKASAPPPQAGGGGADASSMHVFKRKSNPSVEPPAADVDAHLRSLHSPLPTPPSPPAPLDPRVFRVW